MIPSIINKHMHKALATQSTPGLTILAILLLLVFAAPSLQAHPAFNIRRGLEALQGGDLEQAETELQRARFAAPENPVVSYNLGVVSYRRRDYQKAAGFFMQAASAAGVDEQMKFDSLYNLGNSAFKAGDFAAAVSAYSGSIEVKADEQAKYNLEVARKKLQEQQEKQQQEQDQQNKQEKDKNQPKQDQKGQQDKSDQKSGDQSDQQGDQPQSQDNQKDQKDQNAKNDQNDEQNASGKDSESENDKQQKNDQQQAEQKSDEESDQQKADESSSGQEDKNASQTQQLKEQAAADPSENREDVEMTGEAQQQESQKPDASQRARALKNVRLNPYQVERLLQQMQERERQAQLHYRNEPQRTDEADPFNMNAQELHEWFENRNRRRPQSPADEPDW